MATEHARDDDLAHTERYERGKISLVRNDRGTPWWRITVYLGDSRAEIDAAVEEALRVDRRFRDEAGR